MKWIIPMLVVLGLLLGGVGCGREEVVTASRSAGGAGTEDRWEGVVQLRYREVDPVCDDPALAEEGRLLLEQLEGKTLLSFVVDSAIALEDRLDSYDHLVITDRAWLERFGGLEELVPVDLEELPGPMREFLGDQMPVWTRDGSVLPEGAALYEYRGGGLLSLASGQGGEPAALLAERSLVVLLSQPARSMKAGTFLLPLTSSGNLLFTDETALKERAADSALAPYLSEIAAFQAAEAPD